MLFLSRSDARHDMSPEFGEQTSDWSVRPLDQNKDLESQASLRKDSHHSVLAVIHGVFAVIHGNMFLPSASVLCVELFPSVSHKRRLS